jgi:hypothetical protein
MDPAVKGALLDVNQSNVALPFYDVLLVPDLTKNLLSIS